MRYLLFLWSLQHTSIYGNTAAGERKHMAQGRRLNMTGRCVQCPMPHKIQLHRQIKNVTFLIKNFIIFTSSSNEKILV